MTVDNTQHDAGKRKTVIVNAEHPFDLDAYISQYSGRTAIRRLLYIAEECEQLAPQALQLAVQSLTQTRDVNLYQATVYDYNARSLSSADLIPVDTEWLELTSTRNNREKDKLETELKTYSSNMIKESIRMGHRDLGEFYWAVGDYQQALKHYSKSREYSTTPLHTIDHSLTVLQVLLEHNDYSHMSAHVYKAENSFAAGELQNKDSKKAPIPAAGSAAAVAAAASSSNPEREKAQAKLDLAHSIASMGIGSYEKASFGFSKLTRGLEEWFGGVISPSDVAIYGTLCALASMTRSAIKVNYYENDSFSYFLEQEPYTRDILNSYMSNKFKVVLDLIDLHSSRHLLDIHLGKHIPALVNEIRKRCIVLCFQPFASVQLEKMATAFGLSLQEMERMAVDLIRDGRIHARVDSTKKVLIAKQSDPRTDLYQRAGKAVSESQKINEKLLLRIRLIQADLIVRPRPNLNQNQSQGQSQNSTQNQSQQQQFGPQTPPLPAPSGFVNDFYAGVV